MLVKRTGCAKIALMALLNERSTEEWPSLPLGSWLDTYRTLHLWTQIIGKIRLATVPPLNHWWNVALYITPHGLGTDTLWCDQRPFRIEFNFIRHLLRLEAEDGAERHLLLKPQTVADFYTKIMCELESLGITVKIWPVPVEIEERLPFNQNTKDKSYERVQVEAFWKIISKVAHLLDRFRGGFVGKASRVHFFWGSFDLAVTRFSGRRAPRHPGAANVAAFVTEQAYSHEVSSCGFWPGEGLGEPAFYSYAYPEPPGFANYKIKPEAAYYSTQFKEFLLPYEAVRTSAAPEETLMDFFQSTYEAEANLAHWDRSALELEAPQAACQAENE